MLAAVAGCLRASPPVSLHRCRGLLLSTILRAGTAKVRERRWRVSTWRALNGNAKLAPASARGGRLLPGHKHVVGGNVYTDVSTYDQYYNYTFQKNRGAGLAISGIRL
jgi:hypothetical protein